MDINYDATLCLPTILLNYNLTQSSAMQCGQL